SKSMNNASFRSPFIALLSGRGPASSIVGREAAPFEVYSERMKPTDPALAARVPPGQTLTAKWPVLTYGRTPRFDPKTWTFRCFGLVEREATWTWKEFL